MAERMVCKPKVNKAIKIISTPLMINIHQLILVLKAKFSSQVCIPHQAMGVAIRNPIITSFRKSLDSRETIC
jgi:hypothetical protein